MKKCICFLRVSTQQQDLEAQRKAVMKEILHDGFKPSEIETVEGKESAIKLEESERKTLNQLKEYVTLQPTIKDVYFFAIDRLARKVSIVLSIIDEMVKIGVNLHFLNPYPMQTFRDGKEDAMGKAFLTFLAIGAEMEMKIKFERFKATKEKMKIEGKILGGVTLYGYYRDKNGFPQIKDDEAAIVRKIFEEYDGGLTIGQVAKNRLIDGDWPDVKTWSTAKTKVSLIIRNKAYSGRQPMLTGEQKEKNIKYPLIVDTDIQDRCITKQSDKSKPKETGNIYWAKGLVKINVDGQYLPMRPNISRFNYVNVEQLKLGEKVYGCSINVIESIAWMAAKNIHRIMQSYEDFMAPQVMQNNVAELEKKIEGMQPRYDYIKEVKDRINKQYRTGRIDDKEYDEAFADIEKEQSIYDNEVKKLQNQIMREKVNYERMKELKETDIDYDTMDDEERKELCEATIDEIIVEKTDKYDYRILVIPTKSLQISIAYCDFLYNCQAGKKKLIARYTQDKQYDITNEIIVRFKNDKRQKYGKKKKG